MRKDLFRTGIVLSMIILFLGAAVLPSVSEDVVKLSWLSDNEYDFLIISPSEFTESLEPLVIHKNSYDIKTKTVSLDEIYNSTFFPMSGRDNPEKIKYFIKNTMENWNISYVMLVGNKELMPVRYRPGCVIFGMSIIKVTTDFISDLYYADVYDENNDFCSWDSNNNNIFGEINENNIIDKVDLYPDIAIGRLPCSNESELIDVVNKIILYEKNTYNKDWFNNLIVCGGNGFSSLNELLGGNSNINFIKPISEGEMLGETIITNLSEFNPIRLYASKNFPFGNKNAEILTVENIVNAFNEGAGFSVFSGHGNPNSYGTYAPYLGFKPLSFFIRYPRPNGLSITDIQKFSNDGKLPVTIFDSCGSSDFSNKINWFFFIGHLKFNISSIVRCKLNTTNSPIAWEFVKKSDGGAIATFGGTSEVPVCTGLKYCKTLGPRMVIELCNAYANGTYYAGDLLNEAINKYLTSEEATSLEYSTLDRHYGTIQMWILFGDPTLKIGGYP